MCGNVSIRHRIFYVSGLDFLSRPMASSMARLIKAVARVENALEDAGVPKASIQAGPKELMKEVDGKLLPLVYMLMGAQTYLKFVQKRRDYKYIVSAANTAKPMLVISVSDLDVYCKIELPKVADGNWRMLHLQIGESCKTFAKSSRERCSA